jgi:single-stranded DNA-binding protein
MCTQDLNQLTISGHVRSKPQLRQYTDGDSVCMFVLTHTTDHHESGNWELQFYNVHIWGPDAEYFDDMFELDQRVVVTGRLDSIYDESFTGYQPIVSIIANHIIAMPGPVDDTSYTEQLSLP